MNETQRPEGDDELRVAADQARSQTWDLISGALEHLYQDDEEFQRQVSRLREDAVKALGAIEQAFRELRDEDHSSRWGLVYLATRLEHPAMLPFLKRLVTSELPLPPTEKSHRFSRLGKETTLRTTAIEGVKQLASIGNKEATEALLDFVEMPSLSIKRAAVQALLSIGDSSAVRERIEKALGAEERFLMNLRRMPVGEIPQVADPTVHLKSPSERKNFPAPPLPEGRNSLLSKRLPPRVREE